MIVSELKEVSSVKLGEIDVSKVIIGDKQVYPENITYIEYIGTTGINGQNAPQILNTGIKGSSNIQFDFDIETDYTNGRFIFGSGLRANNNAMAIFCKYENGASDNGIRYDFRGANVFIPTKNVKLIDTNTRVNFNNLVAARRLDYENLNTSANPGTFTSNLDICMFGKTQEDGVTIFAKGSMKCYYLKLWDNGVLVRDMVPVRVGQVGYMYDRVSNTLFGNAGTGDFVLGPDL